MRKWILILCVSCCGYLSAQTRRCVPDSADFVVSFRMSKWELDPAFGNNAAVLDSIGRLSTTIQNDSLYRLRHVLFIGGASPEGSIRLNQRLSQRRARSVVDYLNRYMRLSDDQMSIRPLGRDWAGVLRLAERDNGVPYRAETIGLLKTIVNEKRRLGHEPEHSLERLKALRGGVPYVYLYRNIFPAIRASKLVISYERILPPVIVEPQPVETIITPPIDSIIAEPVDTIVPADTIAAADSVPLRPFYMDLRSNMLYDALMLPNIGIEFYLGKNWSVLANWMYGWWKHDPGNWYWRAYGGDIAVRKWFGKAAKEKPLTGHHLGLYGQIFTYDFETGGRGYIGGKPGGNLWDKMNYAAGVEYGYSLPIARRLNIDFTIGIGYMGGTYYEYVPMDNCYVWQATKQRHWFGPTKAEISLVWLIGRGNFNKAKEGGKQ